MCILRFNISGGSSISEYVCWEIIVFWMGAFPLCSAACFILAIFLKALKPQAYPSTRLNHSNILSFSVPPPLFFFVILSFTYFSNQNQIILHPAITQFFFLKKKHFSASWEKKNKLNITREELSTFPL